MYTRTCRPIEDIIARESERKKRRRGKQKVKWTDNIEEWAGLTFEETQRFEHVEMTGAFCGTRMSRRLYQALRDQGKAALIRDCKESGVFWVNFHAN